MSKPGKMHIGDKPEQLDDFIRKNMNYSHMHIFNYFKPPQDYYVVPLKLMTRKLYGLLDKLNEISQINVFYSESKITRRYDGYLSDDGAIIIKITKPILDNLLTMEDLTQELKLLASLTSNREFTEVPARSLGYESLSHKLEKVLYPYSDFEKMFKLRYKNRGFKIYQVKINSISWAALFQLHSIYLFYPSSMLDYGFLCYPVGDSKKISSLDNLNQEEKTEVLASILGIQLETNGPGNQAHQANQAQWVEEGAQHAAPHDLHAQHAVQAHNDFQEFPEEFPEEFIEEGAQEGIEEGS